MFTDLTFERHGREHAIECALAVAGDRKEQLAGCHVSMIFDCRSVDGPCSGNVQIANLALLQLGDTCDSALQVGTQQAATLESLLDGCLQSWPGIELSVRQGGPKSQPNTSPPPSA